MKILIYLFVAVLAVCVLAKRPVFTLNTLGWAETTTTVYPFTCLASSKDLLAYYEQTGDRRIAVRRRNSEGGYDLVANLTDTISPSVYTNGKWIWSDIPTFYKIDNNNNVSGPYYLSYNSGDINGGSMLSDDTFVTYNRNTQKLVTYQYQAQYNNWTRVAGADVDAPVSVYNSYDMQSYRAYDNYLVVSDATSSSVKIYQRQADKSWKLNENITVVNSLGINEIGVHYNGVDTVVFVAMVSLQDKTEGAVFIYTKKNGKWNEQFFNTTSVGYLGKGNLGASCAFIDQNTLLVSAGTANLYPDKGPFLIGKVLMMTKTNGGDWTPYMDIIGDDSDVFGMSIAVNDYDLVVHDVAVMGSDGYNPTGRFRVYAAPRCFAQPINVTCNNQRVSDCSSLDNAQLYTVNQSPRCGAITPLFNGARLTNQTMQASFTFTRFEIENFSCNATVTCPAPVVAKVSGGSMIQCFSLAVLALYLAVF